MPSFTLQVKTCAGGGPLELEPLKEVVLPSTVPPHGVSPSLPGICSWQTLVRAPPASKLDSQRTLPCDDVAQSLSVSHGSPGFFVPPPPLPKTPEHEGARLELWLQKSGLLCAARISFRHASPLAASYVPPPENAPTNA